MKPFIEVAGGNHLPAICYAQTGGMAYLGDYHYSKEHWQGQSLGWFCRGVPESPNLPYREWLGYEDFYTVAETNEIEDCLAGLGLWF